MSQQPCTFTTANGLRITIPACQPLAAASKSNVTETVAGDKSDAVGVRVDSTRVRADLQSNGEAPVSTDAIAPRVAWCPDEIRACYEAYSKPGGRRPRCSGSRDEGSHNGSGSTKADGLKAYESNAKGRCSRRGVFCPAMYREPIVNMMEKHYCAHPLLPGYAPPSPEGIKRWAMGELVQEFTLGALGALGTSRDPRPQDYDDPL
ncbi:hypothetical protein B0H10DRAFT_2058323 [Mycena sp. CBHHK59/15]|nr:hypothetical protein B0H10DRAFT_2058323 [Mycena sp. CBHHK59/15]